MANLIVTAGIALTGTLILAAAALIEGWPHATELAGAAATLITIGAATTLTLLAGA